MDNTTWMIYDLQKATEKLLELISSHSAGPELNLAIEHAYHSMSRVRVKFRKDFEAMLAKGKAIHESLGINNEDVQ